MTKSLVTISNLSVELGGNPILVGLHAELLRNQITALVGINGSGKTTLLRALLKEIPYTGAVAFHGGQDSSKPNPQHVGYVPQRLKIESNLPMTVRDLLGAALQRGPIFFGFGSKLIAQISAMLHEVGASEALLDKPVEK